VTQNFTLLFLFFFALTLGIRLWLAAPHPLRRRPSRRRAARVRRARDAGNPPEGGRLHRRPQQDRRRGTVIDAALLLAFTLGGGLAGLHDFWAARLDGLFYGLAMIFSLMLISGLVDLPLSLYSQFVIEARHGFNRMTLGLFIADLIKQTLLGSPSAPRSSSPCCG
jgi:STE24 endopeptidase